MKKFACVALVVALLPFGASADERATVGTQVKFPLDLSTPEQTAHSMMKAMYLGSAEMLDKVFVEDAQLRRITADGQLRPDGYAKWRAWVGEQAKGDVFEDIFGVETRIFGNLATVWAPFVVSYKNEIVGCGVNQLSMARQGGEWRIVSGMDTNTDTDCATFKADYLSELALD